MTKVMVEHGICGFKSTISAAAKPDYTVEIVIDSDCPNLVNIPDDMLVIDPIMEMTQTGSIGGKLAEFIPHTSCVCVPAIIKAAEAEAGLALKKDVSIRFEE